MTPLGPGGQNGGAGLVATSLVRHLSQLAPELDLLLLTAAASHAELADLDAANVRRLCVRRQAADAAPLRAGVRRALNVLPPRVRARTRQALQQVRQWRPVHQAAPMLDGPGADLLVCPFSVPYFWRPGVPLVSVVHDLQEQTYPQFFTPEQRLFREQHLRQACARSARVVCVSEYVRRTLLAHLRVPPERVVSVPLALLNEPPAADVAETGDAEVLERLGVRPETYLLYPANFWPHKNHRTLFEALRRYRARRPTSALGLVCTGAPSPAMAALRAEAGPEVVFAGYVAPAELRALLRGCRAVVVPSLYEGFGMPVLEGMAYGKPVLCSDVTSLPEVAGDAALYFDPTDPRQIAAAIGRLEDEPTLVAELVRRGHARAAHFGTGRDLAARYLAVFEDVFADASRA